MITALAIICGLLLFSNVGLVRSETAVNESEEIVLRVTPSVILDHLKADGEEFAVNITAYRVQSLHGFVLRLSYDANLIECTNVQEGMLLSAFGATDMVYMVDSVVGSIHASANLTSPTAVASGNASLIRMTFKVKGVGETEIRFRDVALYDASGTPQAYVTRDGYFNNKLNIDFAMPLVLLVVTMASLSLNGKIEGKLKSILQGREFRVREAVMLVVLMSVMIGLVVILRQISLILLFLFLFAYSMLLFMFGYIFSNNRWYVGIVGPVAFVLLYVIFRDSYIWAYYLGNIYGVIFAVMITVYLASLFTWKATAVFGVLITAMDIVLVLITGTMVEAASAARSLSLPVLVSVPLIPTITTGDGLLLMSLGLGDFFFAGLLTIQTCKKYGKRIALTSTIGMTVSFIVFEAFILSYGVTAFPGTVMIICGWMVPILTKELKNNLIGSKSGDKSINGKN